MQLIPAVSEGVEDLTGSDELTPSGLPRASDLSLPARVLLHATAAGDLVGRIGGGALISATIAPLILRNGVLDRDREVLDFYADAAESGNSSIMFPLPEGAPKVRVRRIRLSVAPGIDRVERLSFASLFEARHPLMRAPYAAHRRNRIAWAQHWRHDDRPRPTIIVIHGFTASPAWANGAFFSMPWFYSKGYDVLFVTLPFHGRRRARFEPYSGCGLFAHGIANINEGMAQAIHDIRSWMNYLETQGVERIGVTGISLGGYTTALMAATDERLHFAIANAPVSDMASMADLWAPTGQLMRAVMPRRGLDPEDFGRAVASHSPLSYPARIPHDRLFIIAGLGDRLAPPSQSEALWEHWDRCQLHWYPGSHALHLSQGVYLRLMGRLMQETSFAEET